MHLLDLVVHYAGLGHRVEQLAQQGTGFLPSGDRLAMLHLGLKQVVALLERRKLINYFGQVAAFLGGIFLRLL